MKEKIHPAWFPEARVHCACGNVFNTGQQKFIDTAGRVDKFNQRMAAAEKKKSEAAERKAAKEAAAASEA